MQKLDAKVLDKIVKQTIAAVEKGKSQIFEIYEAARVEMENVKKDLERVKQGMNEVIKRVDELEKQERRARLRLSEVHRNFKVFSEEDMKEAYLNAENVRVALEVAREQERNLRRQRDDLELRLRNLTETLRRAEGLVTQVGAALGFLGDHMEAMVTKIESLQQREAFAAKIIKAQEEERRRVAREIHDGPAQAMANVVFRVEVCERLLESDITRARDELKDLQEQIRFMLKETRKIIFGLRPMTLDDLGLVPTLRRVLDTMRERSGIFPEITITGDERRLSPYIEVGLFRIVQEALNNVEKHAKASSVRVRLDYSPHLVTALVEDDGQGFDPDADRSGTESFGLMGMQERSALLDGELIIKSRKGKGTKLAIKVPLRSGA
jgi:Signal transduction histidine kinase